MWLNDITLPLESLNNLGKHVKNSLYKYFTDFWKGQIQQSKKLKTLAQVKNNFVFEEYLHEINNVNIRQAVTKMRSSAHRLPVESGRYNKVPHDERKCTLCHKNEIGDEYHYITSCSNKKFVELRYTFMNDIYNVNTSFRLFDTKDFFIYILNIHDKTIVIAKYFHDILSIYDSIHIV